jgi:ribosomal 30S subunit maturation factor RimM
MWLDLYRDDLGLFEAGEVVRLGMSEGAAEAFEVEECFSYAKGTVIKLEGVDLPEDARVHMGAEIFLPEDRVPQDGPDVFDTREVVGYAVQDRTRGRIGSVTSVSQGPAYWIFHVESDGLNVEIPAVRGLGVELDKTARILNADLPDGYPGLPGDDDAD